MSVENTTALPLMEAFYTLQGEGNYTGTPAYFIRLAGCDVGCVWCDVKESWDAHSHSIVEVNTIVKQAVESGAEMAVITGGEPVMYPLGVLTTQLYKAGLKPALETSGTHPISGEWHWICFSPKKFKAPLAEYYERANELKIVINHKSDLAWAEGHAKKVNETCKLFLQPEWDKRDLMLPLIIAYIQQNPKWQLSLQTHKYIGIP